MIMKETNQKIVDAIIEKAKESPADLYLCDDIGSIRKGAFGVIYYALDARYDISVGAKKS